MKRFLRYFLYRELYRLMRSEDKDRSSERPARQSVEVTVPEGLPASGEPLESADQVKAVIQQMDPYAFEHLVADLWERIGWETEVPSRGTDEGVDVIAHKAVPYEQTTLIQAKRYGPNTTVGSPEIQQYASLKHQYDGVDKVVMVTSNRFTAQARELADRLNVKLVDGDDLVELIAAYDAADIVDEHVPFVSQAEPADPPEDGFDDEFEPASTDDGSVEQPPPAEPAELPESLPNPRYYHGVLAATAMWVVYVPAVSVTETAAVVLLGFPAWFGLPVLIYLDSERIDGSWPRYRWAYLLLALVPMLAVVSGIAYAINRRQVARAVSQG